MARNEPASSAAMRARSVLLHSYRCPVRRPSDDRFTRQRSPKEARSLPGLGQCHSEGPALIALQDVVSGKGAARVARPVLEGRVDTHQVLDDELNADVLQIGIG